MWLVIGKTDCDTDTTPGSPHAVKLGCKCPMNDNHYGRGIDWGDGEPLFFMSYDCPLHGDDSDD